MELATLASTGGASPELLHDFNKFFESSKVHVNAKKHDVYYDLDFEVDLIDTKIESYFRYESDLPGNSVFSQVSDIPLQSKTKDNSPFVNSIFNDAINLASEFDVDIDYLSILNTFSKVIGFINEIELIDIFVEYTGDDRLFFTLTKGKLNIYLSVPVKFNEASSLTLYSDGEELGSFYGPFSGIWIKLQEFLY